MIALTDAEFNRIMTYVRKRYGINLEKKRYLIENRLAFEVARCQLDDFASYWDQVISDKTGKLEQRMVDRLTTNYTFFLREDNHFDFLKKQLLEGRFCPNGTEARIWSAGCSTGQECYTLAMLLEDCRLMGCLPGGYRIQGSDLSAASIAAAQRATYGAADYARLLRTWQVRYCTPFSEGEFSVVPDLCSHVTFEQGNLFESNGGIACNDVVFCRNVLIYFCADDRRRLVDRLVKAIKPGGFLFVGHTESLIECPKGLEYVQPAIYRRCQGGSHAR